MVTHNRERVTNTLGSSKPRKTKELVKSENGELGTQDLEEKEKSRLHKDKWYLSEGIDEVIIAQNKGSWDDNASQQHSVWS